MIFFVNYAKIRKIRRECLAHYSKCVNNILCDNAQYVSIPYENSPRNNMLYDHILSDKWFIPEEKIFLREKIRSCELPIHTTGYVLISSYLKLFWYI